MSTGPRPSPSFFPPRGHGRRGRSTFGESVIFLAIFIFGLTVFFFQLFTWTIPYGNSEPEYEKSEGTVTDARLLERMRGLRLEYCPEWEIDCTIAGERHHFRVANPRGDAEDAVWTPDKTEAGKILGLYPVGKPLPIWISVEEPRRLRLSESPVSWGWYIQLIAFALVVLGAFRFWGTVRFRSISDERHVVQTQGMSAVRTGQSGNNTALGGPGFLSGTFDPTQAEPFVFPGTLSKGAASADTASIEFNRPAVFPTVPDCATINDSPGTYLAYRMQANPRPVLRMSVMLLLGVLWNAASWSVFVYALWTGDGRFFDRTIGFTFGFVFCGFGLFLLIRGFQQLFQAFGCGPTILEISDHPLYPGRRYRLVLLQPGTFRVNRFELRLVCEEIARYRQGTDTITNRKEVVRNVLFERDDFEITRDQPLHHETLLRLPLGAMHSMRCEFNEIVWKLVVHAQIAGWPDLLREWEIVVRPNPLDDSMQDEESG